MLHLLSRVNKSKEVDHPSYISTTQKDLVLGEDNILKYVDMKLSVTKSLSARWIISAHDYLRSESGSVCGRLVEVGICEALDKPESDSEGDLLPTLRNS